MADLLPPLHPIPIKGPVPHARGDEPEWIETILTMNGRSPRTWG
jgi:hypothetical protein